MKHNKLFLTILFGCILSILMFTESKAATYTVTNTNDAGGGSLRQAILDANGTADDDVIEFSVTGTITLGGTELTIADNGSLTINGPGADQLTISGGDLSRVFQISNNANVEINGVTISSGKNSDIYGYGGGIYSQANSLVLNHVVVTNNRADISGYGGGICSFGNLTLNSSTVSSNNTSLGGGIYCYGNLTVNNSTISNNNGVTLGGGINCIGIITVENSTVSNNNAGTNGGGIIFGGVGSLTVNNSTISSNTASFNNQGGWEGGGIYNYSSSSIVTVFNSIIAGNSDGAGYPDFYGAVNSIGYNLIGDGSGSNGFTATGDHVGNSGAPIDPMLGPLQDNGGPTFTQALLPGSPAIDAGDCGTLTVDQRGITRPQGGVCDIGAFEFLQLDPLSVSAGEDVTFLLGYDPSVTLTATAEGGTPPYSYEWVPGGSGQSITVSPTTNTTYTVTVTDAAGNTASDEVVVNVEDVRCGNNLDKISILHRKGNGSYARICISANALAAHLAHGDVFVLPKSGVEGEEEILTEFSLAQNFPNPFNPTTQIRFGIPEAGNVTLKVYNSVGQLVKILVNENMSEGYYQVIWDATDNHGNKLSSGIYFYRITSGDFVQINKMLLLK